MRWTYKNSYLYTYSELQGKDGWLTHDEIHHNTTKERDKLRRSTKQLFSEFIAQEEKKEVQKYNL